MIRLGFAGGRPYPEDRALALVIVLPEGSAL